jgi:hypothetical protein
MNGSHLDNLLKERLKIVNLDFESQYLYLCILYWLVELLFIFMNSFAFLFIIIYYYYYLVSYYMQLKGPNYFTTSHICKTFEYLIRKFSIPSQRSIVWIR